MTNRTSTLAGLPVFLLAVSLSAAAHDHGRLVGVQSLDVSADGRALHLLVADYDDHGRPQLLHQRSGDEGETWSKPVRVDQTGAAPKSPHRGMDAQIAVRGRHLVAVWMSKGTGFMESGPMVTALSSDGGKTWRAGPNPADDGSTTGHGYVDVTADERGVFHLVWLDSRDGSQGLRYARSTDRGSTWSANATLKSNTCECCWNTLAVSGRSVHVLFRDKAPRDMALVSSADAGVTWGTPRVVGRFDWEFEGCPHVGGGLAATKLRGNRTDLHALVWTGAAGSSGTHVLSSTDGGAGWSVPAPVGTTDARRGDIAAQGSILVAAWERVSEDGSSIYAAKSWDGGQTWNTPKRISQAGRLAAYPRVVAIGKGFRVFWTETGSGTKGTWQSAPF